MSYLARHRTALLYLVAGQIGWFACVLSAAANRAWMGVAVVTVLLVGHVVRARRAVPELMLVLAVTGIGTVWDSAMVITGLLHYPHESPDLHHAPYWIIALWALFAAQLNVAYGWMKPRLTLAALLGALAGPLSFRAGAALHAVRIDDFWKTMPVLAVGWACLLPVAALLTRRWNGIESPAPAGSR